MNRKTIQIVLVIFGALVTNTVYCADETKERPKSILERLQYLEDVLERIERLEEKTFGEKRSGPFEPRLEALAEAKRLKKEKANLPQRSAQEEPKMENEKPE